MNNSLIDTLRSLGWNVFNVSYVLLFGSMARGSGRDIDLAIKFSKKPSLEEIGAILDYVSQVTGYPVKSIDIVVLNSNELPCELIYRIYSKNKPVYIRDLNEYIDDYIRWIKICYDYEIMLRKNRVLETALEVVEGRWGS